MSWLVDQVLGGCSTAFLIPLQGTSTAQFAGAKKRRDDSRACFSIRDAKLGR